MVAPLPPVVDGPVYAVANAAILVDNLLPDALVKVLQDGIEIGHATSTVPGALWVPTTVPLVVGKTITATQTYTGSAAYIDATPGTASAPASVPIPVQAVPDPLPVPVFLSGISQCSSSIWLGSLVQGCTLRVWQGANTLVTATIAQPQQWFDLAAFALTPGTPLQARQDYRRDFSPVASSLPVFAEPTSLSEPVIGVPIRDCQTDLDVSNVTPGANLEVTNAGTTYYATSPWPSYTLVGLAPLQQGPLTAQQNFTRCKDVPKSKLATFQVTKTPVPLPEVGYALCGGLRQFTVSNLVPGEILTLKRVVTKSGGGEVITPVGAQGVSSATVTVNLPPSFASTDPQGVVSLRLSVTLCGLETSAPPAISIPFSIAAGPFGPAAPRTPLYDCATSVTVLGAHPGSIIRLIDGTGSTLLANPVVATAAGFAIPLWAPLVTGQTVVVEQSGCNANGKSKPATVLAVPSPLPVPIIAQPLLAGINTTVDVTGLLPGARVYLWVNGAYRAQLVASASSASLPVGTPALVAEQYVQVTQALCTETSARNDRGPGYAVVLAPVAAPPGGFTGNSNYFLGNGGTALGGLTTTVAFTSDFASTANGYSFQLNCYCTEGPTITTEIMQFVIYAAPGDTQLVARIDNWSGTAANQELNRIDVNLASLPTPTLNAGYKLGFVLTYDNSNGAGTCTGCIFSAVDNNGTLLGSQAIAIVGNALLTTNLPATSANLAPIAACTFDIGGDYGGTTATLSEGAGTITYTSTNPLAVGSTEPAFTDLNGGTVETANLVFGALPVSNSQTVTQTFQVVTAGSSLGAEHHGHRRRAPRLVLPPPNDRSFGRAAAATVKRD